MANQASTKISLSALQTKWYMSWNIYTQAANFYTVTLSDSGTTYVNATKNSTISTFTTLSQGFQQITGTGLTLSVAVTGYNSTINVILAPLISTYNLLLPNGTIVGSSYSLMFEDSNDNDYNDLYVSIVAWQAKN